jgi:hypothetical protein
MLDAFGPFPQGAAIALAAARQQQDAPALAQVALSLGEPDRAKVLAEALNEAQTRGPWMVLQTFAPIARALPHHLFDAVLGAMSSAGDSAVRYMEVFAPYIPVDLLPRAVEIAREKSDSPHLRTDALVALASRTKAATNDALAALLELDESWWATGLAALAPRLPQERLEQVWQASREASKTHRGEILATLAPLFEEPRRRTALQEAVEATLEMFPESRREVLQQLESSFVGRGWDEALALAKVPSDWVVPDMSSRIADKATRFQQAARPGARPDARVSEAMALAEFGSRLEMPLLKEVLETISASVLVEAVGRRTSRALSLGQLADRLANIAPNALAPIWSQALRNLRTTSSERRQLLAEIEALIPALAAVGGQPGLGESADAIREVGAWFP